ncbi:3-oxoacyl-(acyl-carrier-protein) synthase 3 [uncultured delta proteobacterium]|uniref:Beta-ketoacyl-[acyl-carrier-protein] synthase III n=1 Tax=uncultured delta proteobacterium TaxID=34034 RepID=A0A212K3M2_9DELT|nr:3-oxoacyl-(acyl-carrier-protein) synthase 3 [uncultured delta proteobacterium]
MSFEIIGTGSHLPAKIVTNQDFEKIVDTSDEWITQRTGIRQRYFVGEGERNVDMGTEAARRAIAMAGVDIQSIDAIIAGTCTNEAAIPSLACQIQRALGIERCFAFDVNAACSGFIFALKTAERFLTETCKTILVIGGDTMSRFLNMEDRDSCILFGDGAGAAVIRKGTRCRSFALHSRPDVHETLDMAGANARRDGQFVPSFISLKGREVYAFATRELETIIRDGLRACNLTVNDVSLFILHQANLRIIQSVAQRLGLSMDAFYTNIAEVANTSAGCIPIALDQANREGKLHSGDILVMAGVGGGLTSGCAVYEW